MKRPLAAIILLPLLLTACGGGDPLEDGAGPSDTESTTLVVGSQEYYSNEIIAEIYAQALEAQGFEVQREFNIGQREVYMPEIEAGSIDVFPEYNGNLLQYLDPETQARDPQAIAAALNDALPEGITALPAAQATDQDSYTVTEQFAAEHGLTSIADLAKIGGTVTVAANSEFATRPYGPDGLKEVYGVDAEVVPVEDSGGPLTLRTLLDGDAMVADIYTADPNIATQNLVVLDDPKSLILPQQVVPLVSEKVNDQASAAIKEVQSKLTLEELQQLNARSVDDQERADVIATEWLDAQGLN